LNWRIDLARWPGSEPFSAPQGSAWKAAVRGWSMAVALLTSSSRDGAAARVALESAGITVLSTREVVMARLRQDVPGQLGDLAGRMAAEDVNIEVQYSDHDGRLVVVVDDLSRGPRRCRSLGARSRLDRICYEVDPFRLIRSGTL
jgi:hypothetical protein